MKSWLAIAIGIAGLWWAPLRAQPLPWEAPLGSDPDSADSNPSVPALTGQSNRLAYKNPTVAMGLSLAGTAVPVFLATVLSNSSGGSSDAGLAIIMVGGVLAGPSIGQFYASSPGTAVVGMALRVTGTIIFVSGFKDSFSTPVCRDAAESCPAGDGQPQMIIGIATMLGGTLFSIFEAAVAANRFNKKQIKSHGFGWSPTLSPGIDGVWKTGALAWNRF